MHKIGNNPLKAWVDGIMAISSEGILFVDEALKIIKVNKTAIEMLEITEEELLHYSIVDLIQEVEFINRLYRDRKEVYGATCHFAMVSGNFTCKMNARPIIHEKTFTGAVFTFYIEHGEYTSPYLGPKYKTTYSFDEIITQNKMMKRIIDYAKKAAYTDCNILLEGASGTGKELFAQAMHRYSKRASGPFIAVNCAALPRDLIESELFGYEKGAFTGASKEGRAGKFELANKGTIFLDEIGELPLELQSKLLRVVDQHKITRLGGTREKELDVRVISATNRSLSEEVNKKNFRLDLYYRLNVISIHLMQLKDRKEDIALLADYFVEQLNKKNAGVLKKRCSSTYLRVLEQHTWPGNGRQLKNVVERSYYLCEGELITEAFLSQNTLEGEKKEEKLEEILPLKILEKQAIERAIQHCEGNIIAAAELLQISKATIYRKMKTYNISK